VAAVNSPESPQGKRRLEEIETQWSLIARAHEGSDSSAGQARQVLVLRYFPAIRSYVGALLRDDHDADDLAQDVVKRLMQGDFAAATPERGRFRDLLKVAVRNMVRTHWERQNRRAGVNLDVEQLGEEESQADPDDQQWLATWRQGMLDLAWKALKEYEARTPGAVAYTLLKLRAEHPEDDSAGLAKRLGATLGKQWKPDAVRQQLRRARLRFAQFLVDEIAGNISDPTPERIERELIDVGLIEYVREFLPQDWQASGRLREKK
jgi:RNA polymerase sigma-70 factor (ECF subfamily)